MDGNVAAGAATASRVDAAEATGRGPAVPANGAWCDIGNPVPPLGFGEPG